MNLKKATAAWFVTQAAADKGGADFNDFIY